MSPSSSRTGALPGEPSPAILNGKTAAARIKRGLLATRPKFFTASVLPVIVGSGWGFQQSGTLDWLVFLIALIATVLVHAASNVWNDVGDDMMGSDGTNDDRIHPYTGGSRFIQNGVLNRKAMLRLSWGLWLTALAVGMVLVWLKGATVLLFGVVGVALGYLYSSPGPRLSGRGLGETSVALAFGVLPVCGAAWLQGAELNWSAALVSLPVSCWVAAILLINEVPDVNADARSGKRTLVVRLGRQRTAWLYLTLQLIALGAVIAMVLLIGLPPFMVAAPIGLAMVAGVASRKMIGDRAALKQGIEMTLMIHAVGCLWLAGWLWFAPS